MSKKGKLFVVSAPSGAGKTTLCKKLLKVLPNLEPSVSMTTREKRPKEKDGKDYFFITRGEFKKRLKNREFLEHAEVFGNLYGTPREFVEKKIESSIDVLLIIDVKGAMQVKRGYKKNAVFIFILPPKLKDLKSRLMKRQTDTPSEISKRLQIAKNELKYLKFYDYKVVNDDLDAAFKKLKSIFVKEKRRMKKEIGRIR